MKSGGKVNEKNNLFINCFLISGCTGAVSLDDYKSTAKAAIQTYALDKGSNNEYSAENWADIESVAAQDSRGG
jgi:hypothetical protein